jgi:hypothetical protein
LGNHGSPNPSSKGNNSQPPAEKEAAFAAHHHFTLATTTQIHLEKPPSKVVHFDSTLTGALSFDR